MICPSCSAEIPNDTPSVRGLIICPHRDCLRTLALEGDTLRVAVDTDTKPLSPLERGELIQMRKRRRAGQ